MFLRDGFLAIYVLKKACNFEEITSSMRLNINIINVFFHLQQKKVRPMLNIFTL